MGGTFRLGSGLAGRATRFAFILAAVAATGQPLAAAKPKPSIWLPEVAPANVFTWQVGLSVRRTQTDGTTATFRCGGVLVSPMHVLTAAHCVDRSQSVDPVAANAAVEPVAAADVTVRYGSDTFAQAPSFAVKSVVLHEQWRHTGRPFEFDAAVLTLVTAPAGRAIELRNAPVEPVAPYGWVSGWGTVAGGSLATVLGAARIHLASPAACQPYWQNRLTVTPAMLCTVDEANVGCAGDSGGPLVIGSLDRPQLVGIVSAGVRTCGDRLSTQDGTLRFVGVFTRAASIADWVIAQTGGLARVTAAAPGPLFDIPKSNEM